MIAMIRPALGVLALALLAAGCSERNARQLRPASQEEPRGRPAGQFVGRDGERSMPAEEAELARSSPRLTGSAISPQPVREITLDGFRQHVRDETAKVLDVRGARDFERGHVRGAVNVPAGQVQDRMGEIAKRFVPSDLIIIYCNGPHCDSSEMAYEILATQGYENLRVFKPGWDGLREAEDLH